MTMYSDPASEKISRERHLNVFINLYMMYLTYLGPSLMVEPGQKTKQKNTANPLVSGLLLLLLSTRGTHILSIQNQVKKLIKHYFSARTRPQFVCFNV